MKRKYKQIIIEQINKEKNNFRESKEIYQSIVDRIFGERTTVYIDDTEDKNRYIVGIHFEDCNYYEIELTDENTEDDIVGNLLNNLVLERLMNKQNQELNWNNVRYFDKEEKERSKK